MPFLKGGGLFVSTTKIEEIMADCPYESRLCLLLQLPDEEKAFLLISKVAWLTPARQSVGRCKGIGLQFIHGGVELNTCIEAKLAGRKLANLKSQTL